MGGFVIIVFIIVLAIRQSIIKTSRDFVGLGPSSACTASTTTTTTTTTTTELHSNQDLLLCVKIGMYSGFWVHRGF